MTQLPRHKKPVWFKVSSFLGVLFAVLFITSFIPTLYFYTSGDIKIFNLVMRSVLIAITPVILLPVIYWISVKKPIFKNWKNVLLHVGLSLLFCLIFLLIFQVLILYLLDGKFFFGLGYNHIESIIISQFFTIGSLLFFSYWGLVVLSGLDKYFEDLENMQQKSNELQEQLELATLSSLRAQLKPHFLFNTLSMIDHLITQKPEKAIGVVNKLEHLLRNTFDRTNSESCTLAEEIAFLKKYLAIEESRFHDRLEVRYSIFPETRGVKIPRYLLQPLVENALVHGVGKTMKKCTIEIKSELLEDQLRITVKDNGPGLARRKPAVAKGIGLKNVRERIQLYFGEHAALKIIPLPSGGVMAAILIAKNNLIIEAISSKM